MLFINPRIECVLGLVGLLRVVASKVPQRLIGALCSSLPNFPTLALTHISSESVAIYSNSLCQLQGGKSLRYNANLGEQPGLLRNTS